MKFINKKGQAVLESILIMLIFLGLFRAVVGALDANEFLNRIVREPLIRLDHMVRNGEWTERRKHPNYLHNHLSQKGDDVR